MSEIDDIKRRMTAQFQAQLQQRQQQEAETQQQLAQAEAVVKQYLTTEALERYGNIKAAHPDTAMQVIVMLAQAIQSGQLRQKVDDAMLKKILGQLTKEREITITRR